MGLRQASWFQWTVRVWIAFTVAASVKVLVQPTTHTVYPVFVEGARNWWQDVSLYTFSQERDLFRYSPTFAVLMTPFAWMSDRVGGVLWLIGNVVFLFTVLHWAGGEVFPGVDTSERKGIWLLLTLVGVARSFWAGQSNGLILGLAIAAMLAIRRRRWWLAALLLTCGGFIKVWPWVLALLTAACWPRQLIFRLLVAMLVWGAIPFLTRPPEIVLWQYHEWFQMLYTTQVYRWGGYRDAWTIWELIQSPVPREMYELIQCESGLLVLAWCLWQRQQLSHTFEGRQALDGTGDGDMQNALNAQGDGLVSQKPGPLPVLVRESEDRFSRLSMSMLGAWSAWQLLFGPGTERLTYILIAPMLSWAVLASYQSGRYRAWAIGAWVLVSLFSMGAWERLVLKLTPWGKAFLPLGVVVFVVWLVLHETCPGPLWRKRPFSKGSALPGNTTAVV